MKICLKTILFIVFVFALSACAKKPVAEDVSWKSEIAEGHSCGETGLPCCTDREPKCYYGQACCIDPNNGKNTICAKECGCGNEGQFCCTDSMCANSGLACVNSVCKKCGGEDEACCAPSTGSGQALSTSSGQACSDGLACKSGSCVKCGMALNPCCADSLQPSALKVKGEGETAKECFGEGKLNALRTECRDGLCAPCGFAENGSCGHEPFCNPGHTLNNSICFSCGGFNQACCELSSDRADECDVSKGLVCQLGFCSPR
jgi:hypothetical protein